MSNHEPIPGTPEWARYQQRVAADQRSQQLRAGAPGWYVLLQIIGALIVAALIFGSFRVFGWFVASVWCPLVNC
jgi:hypothetical protein